MFRLFLILTELRLLILDVLADQVIIITARRMFVAFSLGHCNLVGQLGELLFALGIFQKAPYILLNLGTDSIPDLLDRLEYAAAFFPYVGIDLVRLDFREVGTAVILAVVLAA